MAFEAAQNDLFESLGVEFHSRFVDLERPSVRTHVFETGVDETGVPLVFVHGTGGFGGLFAPLVAELEGIHGIAFDRPGYGLSEGFRYTAGDLRETVVDGVEGLLDVLDLDRVDLVGHSMGGHAAIRFAISHPDRVRRLVTLGALPGFPGTSPPMPIRLLTTPLLGRLVQWMQPSGEAGVYEIAEIFGERTAIAEYPAFVRAMAAHEGDPKASRASLSEFAALLELRGWHDSARLRVADLRALEHGPTVIWGEKDPLGAPDDVRRAVEAIPDVRFETVDSGHIPFLGHPRHCARLVRAAREG